MTEQWTLVKLYIVILFVHLQRIPDASGVHDFFVKRKYNWPKFREEKFSKKNLRKTKFFNLSLMI